MPAAVPGSKNPAADPDPLGDDRALWDLLDRGTPPPAPGPFLTRRVLRAVACFEAERAVPAWRRRLGELFVTRPRVAWSGVSFAAAGAAVILVAGATFGRWSGPWAPRPAPPAAALGVRGRVDDPTVTLPEGTVRESDVGVIADLDELTDSNENHVWLDEDDESAS